MSELPECPRYVAHPQSVWFNEHWRPIIEKLQAENDRLNNYVIMGYRLIENELKEEIKRLKQIVTEPGEGNRYRLLMNDNDKLTSEIRLAISLLREKDKTITKLTHQRDTLKKALEFYADKNNWLRDKDGWRHDMIVKDLDDESLTDWEKRFSGKTARKALQEAE